MASLIDITKPVALTPTTQSVRDNFSAARDEILALQAQVLALQTVKPVVRELVRDVSLAGADVAITGIGFKPKALSFSWVNNGTPQSGHGHASELLTAGVTFTTTWYTTNQIVDLYVAGGRAWCYLLSMDNDGFTLKWQKTSSPVGTVHLQVICHP